MTKRQAITDLARFMAIEKMKNNMAAVQAYEHAIKAIEQIDNLTEPTQEITDKELEDISRVF